MQEVLGQVPVLIVGAGPAGLTTALTLARYGVRTTLIERRSRLSTLPRATAVSTRTMEIVRSFGLEAQVRSGAVDVDMDAWVTEVLASPHGVTMPLGYPTRQQAASVSPTSPACVPQDHLEPVMLARLRSLPEADVRFGIELVSLRQDSHGVAVQVRDHPSNRTTTIRARYVVAGDGAHSTVRANLKVPMEGPDRLVEHSTVLFRAPLWDVVGERRHGLYVITHSDAPGVFVPVGADDRWLFGQELEPGQHRAADLTEPEITQQLRTASGVPHLRPRIERVGRFSFAAQLASTYRHQRVFLIADAAHRVTPRGGTGMNTAIHDGHDLGWKLSWVLRDWAAEGLLDLYEAERRPIGMHNTARSADPDGSHRQPAEGLAVDIGDRIPHAWLTSKHGRTSTLDLIGPGLTLLTEASGRDWRRAVPDAVVPTDVHTVDRAAAAALGIRGSGAVLVRPDGRPTASWAHTTADPSATLTTAIGALIGNHVPGRAMA